MCRGVFQEGEKAFAGDLLYDPPGDDVAGVGILPVFPRLEIQRLFRPSRHDRLGRGGLLHGREGVVFGVIVLIAGRMAEDLPQGDLVGVRQIGEPAGDVVIEGKLALGLQDQNGGCGKFL
jgi:hypothetical protein